MVSAILLAQAQKLHGTYAPVAVLAAVLAAILGVQYQVH